MRYQVRDISQVHTIDSRDVSFDTVVMHFVEYGYEYLYIVRDNQIKDVISYHEFIKHGLDFRKRDYILDSRILHNINIENYLEKNYSLNRLVVLEDEQLLYEINLMTEPELLHSVERELFSLRFLPLFRSSISNQIKEYEKIYIFSNDEIFDFIKENSLDCNLLRADLSFAQEEICEGSAILDYQLGSKLRKKVLGEKEQFVISIYNLIEREAFRRLINYCKNKNLNLRMIRIPNYDSIKNLSKYENEVVQYGKGFLDLICDDDYLNEFCRNSYNKSFIKQRGASRSVRYDNGIWVTQGDCNEEGISVINGIRCNNKTKSVHLRTTHFFGPCIVFGMLVTNEDTISEQYKKACKRKGIDIAVENHGGLHGNNVLNSLIGALAVPKKTQDSIVIIDYFDDLPKKEYTSVEDYGFIFDRKTSADTWFLDHPVHCNGEANRIIAEYLCDSLLGEDTDEISHDLNIYEYDELVCSSRYFTVSNTVGIKTKKELSKAITMKWGTDKTGISTFIVYDIEDLYSFNSTIEKLLKKEEKLVLCYAFDHLPFEKQREYVSICSDYKQNNKIVVFQLNPYFNIFNYGDEKLYGNAENLKNTIEDFMFSVIVPNEMKKCYLKKQITGIQRDYIMSMEKRNNKEKMNECYIEFV